MNEKQQQNFILFATRTYFSRPLKSSYRYYYCCCLLLQQQHKYRPPGTGKTFIGVKLVELLLHNKALWWNKPGEAQRPILMVCFTNHALDQFLEMCVDVCKLRSGVVRVGSRSQCEKLNPFCLSTIKQHMKANRTVETNIYFSMHDQLGRMRQLKFESDKLTSKVRDLNENSLLSMSELSGVMTDGYLKQFYDDTLQDKHSDSRDIQLLEWLGFFNIEERVQLREAAADDSEQEEDENNNTIVASNEENSQATTRPEDVNEEEEDEEEEDDEYIDSLNRERMLEADTAAFDDLFRNQDTSDSPAVSSRISRADIKQMLVKFKLKHGSDILLYLLEAIRGGQRAKRTAELARKNEWHKVGAKGRSRKDKADGDGESPEDDADFIERDVRRYLAGILEHVGKLDNRLIQEFANNE